MFNVGWVRVDVFIFDNVTPSPDAAISRIQIHLKYSYFSVYLFILTITTIIRLIFLRTFFSQPIKTFRTFNPTCFLNSCESLRKYLHFITKYVIRISAYNIFKLVIFLIYLN